VVIKNESGAGTLLATNAKAVADPEDSRLLIMNTVRFAAAQIADAEGLQYDLSELAVVRRFADATPAVVVGTDSRVASFAVFIEAEDPVRFVATGPGSDEYIVANVLSAAYGFPAEVITGCADSSEARTAVIAGDADAHALSLTSQVAPVEAGEIRPVLVVDDEAHELLPDAPPISEFSPAGEEGKALADSLVALGESGRAIAGPPGLPEDRPAELRAGSSCALSDQAFVNELESQQRPVNVLDGTEYAEASTHCSTRRPSSRQRSRRRSSRPWPQPGAAHRPRHRPFRTNHRKSSHEMSIPPQNR
jgi:tripartite-type tricarboxylate transporter receptor subunit TctC